MYRYKKSVGGSYERQGYIYFTSLRFRELPKKRQGRIAKLCRDVGGEYEKALFEFVTTDTTATAICMKYALGRSTLYRVVADYYRSFPENA